MKVKILKRIKIAGYHVEIFYEDKLYDNHCKYGQSRFPENEIALQDRDMSDDTKAQCLIHEVLHFIDRAYNNFELEEHEINAFATGIHALLVDMGVEFDWSEITSERDSKDNP